MDCKELHKMIVDDCIDKANKRLKETDYEYQNYYCNYTCPKCKQVARITLEIDFEMY